jgi:chromosome segregation ATPase
MADNTGQRRESLMDFVELPNVPQIPEVNIGMAPGKFHKNEARVINNIVDVLNGWAVEATNGINVAASFGRDNRNALQENFAENELERGRLADLTTDITNSGARMNEIAEIGNANNKALVDLTQRVQRNDENIQTTIAENGRHRAQYDDNITTLTQELQTLRDQYEELIGQYVGAGALADLERAFQAQQLTLQQQIDTLNVGVTDLQANDKDLSNSIIRLNEQFLNLPQSDNTGQFDAFQKRLVALTALMDEQSRSTRGEIQRIETVLTESEGMSATLEQFRNDLGRLDVDMQSAVTKTDVETITEAQLESMREQMMRTEQLHADGQDSHNQQVNDLRSQLDRVSNKLNTYRTTSEGREKKMDAELAQMEKWLSEVRQQTVNNPDMSNEVKKINQLINAVRGLQETTNEHFAMSQDNLAETREKMAIIEKTHSSDRNEHNRLQSQLDRVSTRLNTYEAASEGRDGQLKSMVTELAQMERWLSEVRQQASSDPEMAGQVNKIEQLRSQVARLQQTQNDLQTMSESQLAEMKKDIDQLEGNVGEISSVLRQSATTNQIDQLKTEMDTMSESQLAEMKKDIDQLEGNVGEISSALRQSATTTQIDQLKTEMDTMSESQLAEMKKEIDRLDMFNKGVTIRATKDLTNKVRTLDVQLQNETEMRSQELATMKQKLDDANKETKNYIDAKVNVMNTFKLELKKFAKDNNVLREDAKRYFTSVSTLMKEVDELKKRDVKINEKELEAKIKAASKSLERYESEIMENITMDLMKGIAVKQYYSQKNGWGWMLNWLP